MTREVQEVKEETLDKERTVSSMEKNRRCLARKGKLFVKKSRRSGRKNR
jgi:hypothetical protein